MNLKNKIIAVFALAVLFSIAPVNVTAVTINVNASSSVRPIPDTMFGTNTQTWDGLQNGGNDNFNNLMAASGRRYVRWPGGSWGDAFLWSDMEGANDSQTWIVSYDESLYWINKQGGIMQPIVNFPGYWYNADHSDACAISAAVAWVRDQSSRIPTARYWEIGNEIGGFWEAGFFQGIDGGYYGNLFGQFSLAMKAVNPNIKIGAVAEPTNRLGGGGSQDYVGYWTHDLLVAAEANWGVVPDFLIIHQYPGSNYDASYNYTLLSTHVSNISTYTSYMNTMITNSIGSQYVGKIKYWMTEWDAGGRTKEDFPESYYERWTCYVDALFQSQYILEMAKYGWEGSNPWSQTEYHYNEAGYPNFYVFPKWYISPMLSNHFGRDMVSVTTTDARVRAYASRDDANNLTLFIVNNYPDINRATLVNISGFDAGTNGELWLIEPAGTVIPGGLNIQDYNDLKINGVVHPDPFTIATLSGVPMTTGSTFNFITSASTMMLIKIPPATPAEQLPYNDTNTPWPIPGTIEAEDYDTGGKFISYYDTNTDNTGGQYRSDEVDIETCSEGGYDVNGIYAYEWLEYTVNVESSGIYKVYARVASADSNGQFRIEFDGNDETGPVSFTPTGDAQTFTTAEVNHVFLQKGLHTMRLLMDANGWSINWLEFTKLGGGTNKALREWWTGISGSAVSNLTSNVNYPYNPTGRELAHSFEGPSEWANSYGTHIRGYLNPVADGNYTFWIASGDAGELWFSMDADPNHKTRIAYLTGSVSPYKWDKNVSQKSSVVQLVAGQIYYIEAIHKENDWSDSIAVAWQGPGIIRQAITGPYLTPYLINFMDFGNFSKQWLRTDCTAGNAWCSGADLDHLGSVTLDDLMQFIDDLWLFGSE